MRFLKFLLRLAFSLILFVLGLLVFLFSFLVHYPNVTWGSGLGMLIGVGIIISGFVPIGKYHKEISGVVDAARGGSFSSRLEESEMHDESEERTRKTTSTRYPAVYKVNGKNAKCARCGAGMMKVQADQPNMYYCGCGAINVGDPAIGTFRS